MGDDCFGNIFRSQGCSERIVRGPGGKPLPPPGDLIIQHKQQVMFQNPKTGNFNYPIIYVMCITMSAWYVSGGIFYI